MTTEVPGLRLAEGDAGAASARTYQHIMGADPVKEESG